MLLEAQNRGEDYCRGLIDEITWPELGLKWNKSD